MRDTELYRQVLGLEKPWTVESVHLNILEKRVDLQLVHEDNATWTCPECGKTLSVYDHSPQRSWRHLDTCQLQTHLHARIPRVHCPEHGVVQVQVPWALPNGRFTLLMERLIIDVLQETDTVTGAVNLLGITWDEAWGVKKRAVQRGLKRKEAKVVKHIGVDEKAFKKGHSYMTVVCDLDNSTVEYVADDRSTESLAGYFRGLSHEQLWGIDAIAMDMWEPYKLATLQYLPLADSRIVLDRFHIMQHMNHAVDKVRMGEHRRFQGQGGDQADLLTGSKHLWLYAKENLPDKHQESFARLSALHLQTGRAWAIKEMLRGLWDYDTVGWGKRYLDRWYGWAIRSRLSPVKRVAKMLKKHVRHILNHCVYPISNGVAEGLNSRIMTIKRKACGFANRENFKTAIYFHCGGLNLYP